MIITICSSAEFTPEIIKIKKELESKNFKLNIPYVTEKVINNELSFEKFMKMKKENKGDYEFLRKK